jgi:hypothetical protein
MMRELYRKSVFPLAAQVALWDREIPELPSDWDDGDAVVYSARGIAVATGPPEHGTVEVIAVAGNEAPAGKRILSQRLRVGHQGLYIGGIFDLDELPWPSGRVRVRVYVEGPPDTPQRVTFVLVEQATPSD